MRRLIHFPLLSLVLFLAYGCGGSGSGSNSLSGSAETTFNLSFDTVRITRQEHQGQFVAMIVAYIKTEKSGERTPVKVVANAPVEEGQKKDLLNEGSLSRAFDGSEFPKMKDGFVLFDSLGTKEGESTSGEFFVAFTTGTTLNGDFSAGLTVANQ
jgi:hypothetical protein